ncbi:MAG: ribulose-phosphate 3-epimerase [Oscillospiraceae bacterium]|nr:ribulose-phosphate 3-epimerase [Oscillospiraceae bacterium]
MNRQRLIEPSLLAADPGRLAEQMALAERGGAGMWHFDVMDGHFVPNLSFGPHICAGLHRYTKLPIDVHLMVDNPSRIIDPFLAAGAASLVLHVEVHDKEPLSQMLREIRAAGAVPAVALNPRTPPEAAAQYLPLVDRVLVMAVEPGYGGQELLPDSYERVRAVRALANRVRPNLQIQIDGGVTKQNAPSILEAGADILIAGSAVFDAPDIEARCREFAEILCSGGASS